MRVSITRKINVRDPSVYPAWRQGMAVNQWKQLSTATLTSVPPTINPGGAHYAVVDGYNGMAVDHATGKIYFAASGGHADYAGNEAYSCDLSAANPSWSILRQPTPAAQLLSTQSYNSDGRPASSHTYYAQHFLIGRVFRFGAGSLWGPTGGDANLKVDAFNLALGDWDAAGTWADIGTYGGGVGGRTCCQNAVTGDVYVADYSSGWYRYDGATGARTVLTSLPTSTLNKAGSAVDTSRGVVLVAVSASIARTYTIATNSWSANIAISGYPGTEADGHSLDYDASNDFFVAKTVSGALVWSVPAGNISAGATSITTSLASGSIAVPNAGGTAPMGRFRYVPTLGGFVYYPQAVTDRGVYFLARE